MTEMAQHRRQGRWAFGLPTGMGKTSAIIAWAIEHIPEMAPRHERWELDYRRNPYMRD
jgi:hypothetical protein